MSNKNSILFFLCSIAAYESFSFVVNAIEKKLARRCLQLKAKLEAIITRKLELSLVLVFFIHFTFDESFKIMQ